MTHRLSPAPSGAGEQTNRRGFTLTEVILAIALTAVVVYLITTAIELYVVGVDSSRTRVESAQLARALMDQIADDLAAARLHAPPQATAGSASGMAQGASSGGQTSTNNPISAGGNAGSSGFGTTAPNTSSPSNTSTPAPSAMSSNVQGVYGTADVIRIDRGPLANWQRAARQVELQETAAAADMPVSVRYYFIDAQRMSTEQLAERGVATAEGQDLSIAGLYRETQPSAALATMTDATTSSAGALSPDAKVELLAPEVVSFAFSYFDGQDFVDEWDTLREGGLPMGVEIRMTLVEPQFHADADEKLTDRRREGRYAANELVEYRRFVRLPRVDPSPPAQPLLPAANANQGNQPGQNGAQPGGQPGQPNQPGGGGAAPQNNR